MTTDQQSRSFFFLGAILCGLGVLSGAFGAHLLKSRLSAEMLAIFETGVRYHLLHGIALLIVSWAITRSSPRLAAGAGWCFLAGISLFSGSLYLLSITELRVLGAITPFGGLAFLLGWTMLALSAWKRWSVKRSITR